MQFTAPKLTDCTQRGPGSELFIVEGDSAAGAVLKVRDPATQAVLPMQGKPLNATKASAADVAKNLQFAAVLQALRIELAEGLTAEDLIAIPYQRLLLLFDPDADGIHSRTLMLLFFYRWLRPLLDAGRVWDVHAPQWKITAAELPEPAYATTEAHLQRLRTYLEEQRATHITTKRYRGLASLDARTLQQRCISSDSRQEKPLTATHAEEALQVFEQMRQLGRELK